jgi:hypothetical protein
MHDNRYKNYCSTLKPNDIVTVIINLYKNTLEYIINSKSYGIAYDNITKPLVPCICMGEINDQLTILK